MIKKILILSGYGPNKVLIPFGESIRDILCNSFKKLNISVEYEYFDIYRKRPELRDGYGSLDLHDHFIIFLMVPEYFYNFALKRVNKNNNTFVFWNFEPFYVEGELGAKFVKRRALMDKIVENPIIDKMWFYDKSESQIYNNEKCIFVPIGYHECLESECGFKLKSKSYVILGNSTGRRVMYCRLLRSKFAKKRVPQFSAKMMTYKHFKNIKNVNDAVSKFRIGLDICGHQFNMKQVRWHRLVVYAACGVAIFSDCDISGYGFVNGLDYFYCPSAKDCADLLHDGFCSFKKLDDVQKNMRKKLKKDFYMPTILKNALTNTKYWG